MKTDQPLLSWKEAMRLNRRAFLLICQKDQKAVISRMVSVVWSALTPYVGIYLSAQLLSALTEGAAADTVTRLVLLNLVSAAVLSLAGAFLNKWKQTESACQYYKVMQFLSDKVMTMDYADADCSSTWALYDNIEQNRWCLGMGMGNTCSHVEKLLSAILTFSGGAALTISLFTSPVPDSAGRYTLLNSPLFLLVMAVVMIAVTCLSPVLSNKAGSYAARKANVRKEANRLVSFFGVLGFENAMAADIRIYRQDRMCYRVMNDKTFLYSSKGLFARLSRGSLGLYQAASAALSVVFTGVVYLFVCLKALGGAFGIGAVTQYVASITRLSGSIGGLIRIVGDMRNNASFLKPTFEFLDIPNRMYQGSLTVEKRIDRDYEIEFRNVSFRYPGSDTYALKNVSMKFKIGQRLAVVGMNGSGKTTFIKLLCRLYDPTEGEILLNGIDIKKYDYQEYMSVFSVVFQDYSLFAYPLGQNVAGSVTYDRSQAKQCLEDAGFGQRLAELPEGLDTYLYKDISDDGVDISGGESQKIALARTLYRNAPFIVLDEPTAALDPAAEFEVYTRFDDIVEDKTAVYISHRLASCRFCDVIAVFDHGHIVQQGTHEKLLEDPRGKYHALWYAQAQYYDR